MTGGHRVTSWSPSFVAESALPLAALLLRNFLVALLAPSISTTASTLVSLPGFDFGVSLAGFVRLCFRFFGKIFVPRRLGMYQGQGRLATNPDFFPAPAFLFGRCLLSLGCVGLLMKILSSAIFYGIVFFLCF